MKNIVFSIFLIVSVNSLKAQDIINVYSPWENTQSAFAPEYYNPVSGYLWSSNLGSGTDPYSGEYQIYLGNFIWGTHTYGPNSLYSASYVIETVSFPFTMDCAFTASGCSNPSSNNRYLYLPDDADLDPNNPNGPGEWWNYPPVTNVADKLYRITPLDGYNQFNDGNFSTPSNTLVSNEFVKNVGMGSGQRAFPHTVLKITINLHCGTDIVNDPVISTISFLYDNTRGRLRWYPFFADNYDHSEPQYYDLIFRPQLLHTGPTINSSNAYNETDDGLIIEDGTLNYFPYDEINNMNCSTNSYAYAPDPGDLFYDNAPPAHYNFLFPPPYTLISAPVRSYLGEQLAGYKISTNPPGYLRMDGLKQIYHIDKGIDLTNINPIEKIIYNPSEANITAAPSEDLRFPEGYIFKTIRGQYPTYQEALADDVAVNGGPFSDLRDVPVTTDVRSENSAYENLGPNYASMYYLKNGSKLTIEGCVYIFDAAFDCQTGSELIFENYPTNKNPERFKIEYNGGTVTKRAHSFYFQTYNEAESILKFESDGLIRAGYNVTSGTPGDYTVASGANVTFTSDDAVTLEPGFTAVAGSQFVASAVSSVNVPSCTPPQFRLAGYNYSNANNPENADELQIIAYPNPTPGIFRVQLRNSEKYTHKEVSVTDMFGKQILPVDYNLRSRNVIDLSNHPEGIYFVKVIEGDRMAVRKVVKM